MDTTIISRRTILNKETISVLTDAVAQISSSHCVDAVADHATNAITRLLKAETCVFVSRDTKNNRLSIINTCKPNQPGLAVKTNYDYLITRCSTLQHINKELRILQIHDTDRGLSTEDRNCLKETGIKSMLLVPLIAKDQLNGFIAVGQISSGRLFSEQDILLSHLIASQVSAALESVSLYESVRQYSQELEAFHHVGLSITSSLNIKSVISSILRSSMRLFTDAQNSHIFLYENQKLSFVSALWKDGERHEPKANPRPEGLTYTVARKGELIFVADMKDHPLFKNVPADWKGAIIGLPLKFGKSVVGVMTIAFDDPRELTESEHRILKMMGDQAAIAIQNARLYEKTVQNTHQLEALNQASLGLTSSLELEDVLRAIINSSFLFIQDLKDSHIFLYDGEKVTFGAGVMDDGTQLKKPYAEPRKNGFTYTVSRSGKPLLIPDMKGHPMFKGMPADWKGALIGLPLKIHERVVGVMTMACKCSKEFSKEDMKIMRMLGDQAAIAIENANLHKMLAEQAHTDFLTQLPNRRSFDERLEEEIRRSQRYGHKFILAMMDMNGFKRINDTFGHPVGDQVLRQLADCLKTSVRESDFLARVGGDEFALLMPETDPETGRQVIERLQDNIKNLKLILPEGKTDSLSISVGCSSYPVNENSSSGLFHIADQKLYEAKRILKNELDEFLV